MFSLQDHTMFECFIMLWRTISIFQSIPLSPRDPQPLVQFILGGVQIICHCGDTWLRIVGGQNWGELSRALWLCCSWCDSSLTTVQQAFWGIQLHWGLLLLCRTSPVGQRMHVQLLKLTGHTCVSCAHGVGSKWSSVVTTCYRCNARGRMGWSTYVKKCSLKSSSPEATCSNWCLVLSCLLLLCYGWWMFHWKGV